MDIMAFAAAAEETSKHPMAVAILSHLQRNGGHIPPHGEIQTVVGRGVYTEVDGHCIRVGSKRFLNESGIHTHPMKEQASKLFSNGESVIFVARDNEIIGLIGIRDPLRENMKKALNRLRYAGVDDIVLLTGDLEQQADVVAQRLGLDGFESELLPEDKARAVLRMHVIRQNFFVSVGINTVGLLFGGLGMLPVIFGAVMHNASTILVVGNSLRIFFYDMHEPVKHN